MFGWFDSADDGYLKRQAPFSVEWRTVELAQSEAVEDSPVGRTNCRRDDLYSLFKESAGEREQ